MTVSVPAHVRYPEAMQIAGVKSRETLRQWVAKGCFPAPVELGPNSVGWPLTILTEWAANRPQRQYKPLTPKAA